MIQTLEIEVGEMSEALRVSLIHNGASSAQAMMIIAEMMSISAKASIFEEYNPGASYRKEFELSYKNLALRHTKHVPVINEFLAGLKAIHDKYNN